MRSRLSGFVVVVLLASLAVLTAADSAYAAFPGANGKIAFQRRAQGPFSPSLIYSVNPDGSGTTQVTSGDDYDPRWSPDGTKLLFFRNTGAVGIYLQDPVGTPAHFVHTGSGASWSPDGTRIVFDGVSTMNIDGSDARFLTAGYSPEWSPDGAKIAFARERCEDSGCEVITADLWMMNADGSGQAKLLNDASPLDWSPDGSKLLYQFFPSSGPRGVYVMNRDGTGQQPSPGGGFAWSPDGTKKVGSIGSPDNVNLYTVNVDGTGMTTITSTPEHDNNPDWQPLPGSSPPPPYPTPKLAAPIRASLIPVFKQCGTAGNPTTGSHSPPLAVGSCNPQPQGVAHFGPQAKGTAWIATIYGDTNSANGDQADMTLRFDLGDIRTAAGADYDPSPTGADGTLVTRLRFTDRSNGGSGSDPGTATDFDFSVPFACTPTASTTVGSDCLLDTTADAVNAGMIKENKATVLQIFRLRLNDSGPNGIRGDGDDKLFATEGLFIQ